MTGEKDTLATLDRHFGPSPTRVRFLELLRTERELQNELVALFEGMCGDDKPRLVAMRRAALYLEQRGHKSSNTQLFAGKQDPKLSGSGVCTKCGAPAQSRNVDGACLKCAP